MSARAVHFSETKKLLEELYCAKYPDLLYKIRDCLSFINASLGEARSNLQLLARLSKDQPKNLELIGRCAGHIASSTVARPLILERGALVETFESITQNMHAFSITFHSLEHLEERKPYSWRRTHRAVQLATAKVQEECLRLEKHLNKNCQTFVFFENVFLEFEGKAAQLRAEFVLLDNQPEGYASLLPAAGAKVTAHKRLESFKLAADRFRQIEMVTARLELLLEQPRLFAFEFFREEASLSSAETASPVSFSAVISCLNNVNFVHTYMLRFSAAELVYAFRHLFELMDIAELQREFKPFVYHEETFIENYQRFAQLEKAVAEGEYADSGSLLRDIKDYGFESKSARDLSDKIFDSVLRSLKYEALLADFDKFRTQLQSFCLSEFSVLVLIHA